MSPRHYDLQQQSSHMYIFLPRVVNENFNIFIIVFFEFFGTFLFAFFNFNLLNAKAEAKTETAKMLLFYIDFSLSLFMCVAYGRQFSGGVYNPAVTLFRMLRKTDRVTVKIGVIYMIAQFVGAALGSFIAMQLMDIRHAPITGLLSTHEQVVQYCSEIFSTFILAFMAQFMVEKKMTFIEHNQEFYIATPIMYMISRAYSATSNGVNPALGFSFQLAYAINTGRWEVMEMVYILVFGPYTGALVAVFLFQFGMKPMFPLKKEEIQQILQKNLQEREMRLRQRQLKEEEIDFFRREYIEEALQMGISIKSEIYESDNEPERETLIPNKKLKVNHRWTLGQIIGDQALPAPKNYQYLDQLTMIGEQQYFDDDIDSLDDEQEVILQIKRHNKFREELIEGEVETPIYKVRQQRKRRRATKIKVEFIKSEESAIN